MEIEKMLLFISSFFLAMCALALNENPSNQVLQEACMVIMVISFVVIIYSFIRMKKKK